MPKEKKKKQAYHPSWSTDICPCCKLECKEDEPIVKIEECGHNYHILCLTEYIEERFYDDYNFSSVFCKGRCGAEITYLGNRCDISTGGQCCGVADKWNEKRKGCSITGFECIMGSIVLCKTTSDRFRFTNTSK